MTTAHVAVSGADERLLTFGEQVVVDHDPFGLACGNACGPNDIDVLRLAGLVAAADRIYRRKPAKHGWARHFTVHMPVSDPSRWADPPVTDTLTEALEFLTGDVWKFQWEQADICSVQLALGALEGLQVDAVLLFSGGLDSFLLWREFVAQGGAPLLVTARTSDVMAGSVRETVTSGVKTEVGPMPSAVSIPIRLQVGDHAEQTFRTRAFVFSCVAGVAARLRGVNRVLVGENGQGAVGPSLVPFGGEHPYRSTHPEASHRIAKFLQRVLSWPLQFEHPFVWETKGQVLARALQREPRLGWVTTNSCSRDVRRHKGVAEQRPCGICGNCLLRRMAVHAARTAETASYHWNVQASTLARAIASDGTKGTTATDERIAVRSVLSMDALARVDRSASLLRRGVFDMAELTGRDVASVQQDMLRLLDSHAVEWQAYRRSLPSTSWVHSYCGARLGSA